MLQTVHTSSWRRWSVIAAVPIFVFVFVFAVLQASATASQYTFSGTQPPCTVGGDGTCLVVPFTVTAGTPPTDITFAFQDEASIVFQNLNPQFHDAARSSGAGSPGPQFDGGLSPVTGTIKWGMDLDNHTQGTTLTIDFSPYVSGFNLPLFDVDGNPVPFQDRLVVWAFRDATPVTPTIVPNVGGFHDIKGNVVTGTANVPNSDNPAANNATINVRVNDVINRVVIRYESGAAAQANPNPQAIAVGAPMDFTPVSVNAVELQGAEATSTTARNVGIALVIALLALAVASWYITRSNRAVDPSHIA